MAFGGKTTGFEPFILHYFGLQMLTGYDNMKSTKSNRKTWGEMTVVEQKVRILNKVGIHAAASAQFVAFTHQFRDEIYLVKDNQTANAKSLLNLLMLGLDCGSEVLVRVEGPTEEKTLKRVLFYIENMDD